jgi:hypothetical protein
MRPLAVPLLLLPLLLLLTEMLLWRMRLWYVKPLFRDTYMTNYDAVMVLFFFYTRCDGVPWGLMV